MSTSSENLIAGIPLRKVGPVVLAGPDVAGEMLVPLATFETPLWPSVERGARVTARAGGIRAVILDVRLTRSVLVVAPDAAGARALVEFVREQRAALADVVRV